MSRVANAPVAIPAGVEASLDGPTLTVTGGKGSLRLAVHAAVDAAVEGGAIKFSATDSAPQSVAVAGTMRALTANMVAGVSRGWEKKLQLVGVGYRAQLQGKKLSLSLGLSHPVEYAIPAGIEIETPSQTDIVVKGIDRQQVGQVAAEIRAWRPPEPYKGKGVRYADERITRKEAKKK